MWSIISEEEAEKKGDNQNFYILTNEKINILPGPNNKIRSTAIFSHPSD